MVNEILSKIVYCPRCDRGFISSISRIAALTAVKKHVKLAHPDMEGWDETT